MVRVPAHGVNAQVPALRLRREAGRAGASGIWALPAELTVYTHAGRPKHPNRLVAPAWRGVQARRHPVRFRRRPGCTSPAYALRASARSRPARSLGEGGSVPAASENAQVPASAGGWRAGVPAESPLGHVATQATC
jgi:hypothetical protein